MTKAFRASRRRPRRGGLISSGLVFAALASAPAAAKDASPKSTGDTAAAYQTAFGNGAEGTAAAAAGANPDANAALEALRQLGSFPVRVRVGGVDEGDGKGWPDSTRRQYAPKPVARHYQAGACEFTVSTGDFTLRRYEQDGDKSSLKVSLDPVRRFSTLTTPEQQPLIVSVSAELFVVVADAQRDACKKLFGARRIKLGKADLASTRLSATGDDGTPAVAESAGATPTTAVFLTWDAAQNTLVLEDARGLPPAVESPMFTVHPVQGRDFYLAVEAKLGVVR